MPRQADIRAAIQSLLASAAPDSPEATPDRSSDAARRSADAPPRKEAAGRGARTSGTEERFLLDLQATLRQNGIAAEPSEIAGALLHALSHRPMLCRGLLAAYLLDS